LLQIVKKQGTIFFPSYTTVELNGVEPLTSCLQSRRSTN
jgi:hypothetical protein